jgi:hypothetical protein
MRKRERGKECNKVRDRDRNKEIEDRKSEIEDVRVRERKCE